MSKKHEDFIEIPDAMRMAKRWLLWKSEPNPDPTKKPRKVPYYADGARRTGALDTPDDVARLSAFDEALSALERKRDCAWGLGFALGKEADGLHWQGIDLDGVDEKGLGGLASILPGYVERSPSCKGFHAIGRGENFRSLGSNTTGIEAYSSGRYFTVTGDAIGGEIEDLASFVDGVLRPRHGAKPVSGGRETSKKANQVGAGGDENGKILSDVASALQCLDRDDRDTWVRYGQALKPFGGEGFAVWDEWAQGSQKHDPTDSVRVWRSFTENPRVTYRTILSDAQESGWQNPARRSPPSPENRKQSSDAIPAEGIGEPMQLPEVDESASTAARNSARSAALRGDSLEDIARRIRRQWPSLSGQEIPLAESALQWATRYTDGQTIVVGGITKEVVTLASLNARFAQLEVPGMASCVIHIPDCLPISHKDLQSRVSGQVTVLGVNKDGSPKTTPAFKTWRESCEKKVFREIVFTAGETRDGALNLFTGFGVDPQDGNCELILWHLREVVCAGDEVAYEAFLSLLAWQIQHIGRPSRIITVLYSEVQQTGKGTLLEHVLLPMAGLGGFMSHDPGHGLGNFNDQLRGKWLLFLDECSFAGDRKLADKIKSLAVAQTTPIESKGLPVIAMPSALNLWLATNHQWAASAELHDARYWFLQVNPGKAGDFDYFAELYQEINSGGREAFLHLLLNRDVSNFVPQRDVPRENSMLRDVKARSLTPGHVLGWLEESLDAGELLWVKGRNDESHRSWLGEHDSVKGSLLHGGYREWVGRVRDRHAREVPPQDFWRTMTLCGFEPKASNGARFRKIPDPESCKTRLDEFMSGRVTAEAV